MTKYDTVLLALSSCGDCAHIEEIALKAGQIHEGFLWTKHKDQIDKESVKKALRLCRKDGLVSSNKDKWTFTDKGIDYLKRNNYQLPKTKKTNKSKVITDSKLYRKWIISEVIDFEEDQFSFYSMIGVTPNSSKSVIMTELDNLESVANMSKNKKIKDFIKICKDIYLKETE